MKSLFGSKKDPSASISDTSDRITKRGDSFGEKIKRLDSELVRCKEQIKRTPSGPSQEATKARAKTLFKQKKMYENQRQMLYSHSFNLDQVSFALDEIKDAQQTGSKGNKSKQSKKNFFWTCS